MLPFGPAMTFWIVPTLAAISLAILGGPADKSRYLQPQGAHRGIGLCASPAEALWGAVINHLLFRGQDGPDGGLGVLPQLRALHGPVCGVDLVHGVLQILKDLERLPLLGRGQGHAILELLERVFGELVFRKANGGDEGQHKGRRAKTEAKGLFHGIVSG